jgi:hypothetical protein
MSTFHFSPINPSVVFTGQFRICSRMFPSHLIS